MSQLRSEEWLFPLRARFVAVARRRVEPDSVEDIVQEALRVVVERGLGGPGGAALDGKPPIAWCFQVLRNVIGNHYQRARVRSARLAPLESAAALADPARTPLEALEADEAARQVGRALAALDSTDAGCGRYLRRLAEGVAPGVVAREERVAEAAFYRRLYRCREKLRERLATMGILT
jgi:DNA-directed RNA polymerase specialized sigma24 family protein